MSRMITIEMDAETAGVLVEMIQAGAGHIASEATDEQDKDDAKQLVNLSTCLTLAIETGKERFVFHQDPTPQKPRGDNQVKLEEITTEPLDVVLHRAWHDPVRTRVWLQEDGEIFVEALAEARTPADLCLAPYQGNKHVPDGHWNSSNWLQCVEQTR